MMGYFELGFLVDTTIIQNSNDDDNSIVQKRELNFGNIFLNNAIV